MPSIYEKLSIRPVVYDPSFEIEEENEQEVIDGINEEMRKILETTSKDYGHAVRSVHAKAHGLLIGEFEVLPGLPEALSQGLFAHPKTYETVLRFSTNPGDILDDSVTTPRGLSLKLMGVEGERLEGSEGDATQDFIVVNAPVFAAPTAGEFLKTLKLLASTTDTPQVFKKVLSGVLRGAENVLEAIGTESGTLKTLGGHPDTHILGETFFSQAPMLYGKYMAKLQVVPVLDAMKALKGEKIGSEGHPNAIREVVQDYFSKHGAEWEVRVQLLTDPETMPLEDASVEWPQDKSPFIPVARLRVARQESWSEERAAKLDDGLLFSVWHGLAAHRPLGSIMRARKSAYEKSGAFRSAFNGCPLHEPANRQALGL